MKTGFYAGSFDPFTNGHLHVIKKASEIFDRVVVGIGINSAKSRRFNQEKMETAIKQVLLNNNLTNVEVVSYSNLTVDCALEKHCDYLIRGIRNGMDYDYEENVALINEEISGLDTIYIRAGKLGALSSSMVMELLGNNKDVSKFLPNEVLDIVKD